MKKNKKTHYSNTLTDENNEKKYKKVYKKNKEFETISVNDLLNEYEEINYEIQKESQI